MEDQTKGQVEKLLAELGKKIDVLVEETKDAGSEVRKDVEEKIKDLKQKKAKIENDFESYKNDNSGKWTEAKTHLQVALSELKKAIETVFKDSKA